MDVIQEGVSNTFESGTGSIANNIRIVSKSEYPGVPGIFSKEANILRPKYRTFLRLMRPRVPRIAVKAVYEYDTFYH